MNFNNFILRSVFALICFSACNRKEEKPISLKPLMDANIGVANLLSFNISDKDKVKGDFKIRLREPRAEHNLLLPFPASDVSNSIKVLSTSNSYSDFTLINYKTNSKFYSSDIEIPFTPIMYESDAIQIDNLNKGIYLIKSGLDRKFIYIDAARVQYQKNFESVAFDSINWVAVEYPRQAKLYELAKNEVYYSATIETDNIKYYNIKPETQKKIMLSYSIKPNEIQEYLLEVTLKLIGVLGIPIIEIFFIRKNKLISVARKKMVLWILTAIQIILFLMVLYLSFSTEITKEKISDYLFLFVNAILTIVMHKLKKDD